MSRDYRIGNFPTLDDCAQACENKAGCKFFLYGIGNIDGECFQEFTSTAKCPEGFRPDSYNFYELFGNS